MSLPSSGAVRMSDVRTAYNRGSAAANVSDYYYRGGLVGVPRKVMFWSFNNTKKVFDYTTLAARYPAGNLWQFTYEGTLYRARFNDPDPNSVIRNTTLWTTPDNGTTWTQVTANGQVNFPLSSVNETERRDIFPLATITIPSITIMDLGPLGTKATNVPTVGTVTLSEFYDANAVSGGQALARHGGLTTAPTFWIDAADASTLTLTNGNVSSWASKTHVPYSLTQDTATAQPRYVANAINGYGAVRFDGAQFMQGAGAQFMRGANTFPLTGNVATAFMVGTLNQSAGWYGRGFSFQATVDNSTYATATSALFFAQTGQSSQAVGTWRSTGGQPRSNASVLYGNTFVLSAVLNGANAVMYNASVQGPTSLATTGTFGGVGRLAIGSDGTLDPSDWWNGFVAEVMLFPAELTTSERQYVEGYLAWKWGAAASLPAAHPYSFSRALSRGMTPQPSFWLSATDASSLTLDTAGNVSSWTSTATSTATLSSYSLVTETVAERPQYVPAAINGLPALRFDGATKTLNGPSTFPMGSNVATAFAVATTATTSTGTLNRLFTFVAATDVSTVAGVTYGGITSMMFFALTNTAGSANIVGVRTSILSGNAAVVNEPFVVSGVLDGSAYTTFMHSRAGPSGATTGNLGTVGIMSVGRDFRTSNPGNGPWWNGLIAEVMLFPTALSTADRQFVEGYLAWKWGTRSRLPTWVNGDATQPADHPYRYDNPFSLSLARPGVASSAPWYGGMTAAARSSARLILAPRLLNPAYRGPLFRVVGVNGTADLTDDGTGVMRVQTTGQLASTWAAGANVSVTTWYDQSGLGNHATQTDPAARPFLHLDAAGRANVVNFVLYGASARFFNLPDNTLPTGDSSYTIAFRHADVPTAGQNTLIGQGGFGPTANNTLAVQVNNEGQYLDFWWANDYLFNSPNTAGNQVVTRYANAATAGSGIFFSRGRNAFVNGTLTASFSNTGRSSTGVNASLGCDLRAGPTKPLNGNLYYVHVFGTALGAADLGWLETNSRPATNSGFAVLTALDWYGAPAGAGSGAGGGATTMTVNNVGGPVPVLSGTDPLKEYRLGFSAGNTLNRLVFRGTPQAYASFVMTLEINVLSTSAADGLFVFFGATALGTTLTTPPWEQGGNGSWTLAFQIWSGAPLSRAQGLYLLRPDSTVAASLATSGFLASAWQPVTITYTRGVTNTWRVRWNDTDALLHSDPNNATFAASTGTFNGIGFRDSGSVGTASVRNVHLFGTN